MSRCIRLLACLAFLLAILEFASINVALACACCSERGTRIDRRFKLDDATRHQIERMTFAADASLTSQLDDDARSPMLPGASSSYELTVTRDKGVMTFMFREPKGRNGRLSFTVPNKIWIFTVDPFGDAKDEGLGPSLYKEWRLTTPVKSDGIFRRARPPGHMATLIFHGRGRGCTEAEHFTDWSLLLQGPAGDVMFYGALEKL
jgi:hypothetical protein